MPNIASRGGGRGICSHSHYQCIESAASIPLLGVKNRRRSRLSVDRAILITPPRKQNSHHATSTTDSAFSIRSPQMNAKPRSCVKVGPLQPETVSGSMLRKQGGHPQICPARKNERLNGVLRWHLVGDKQSQKIARRLYCADVFDEVRGPQNDADPAPTIEFLLPSR